MSFDIRQIIFSSLHAANEEKSGFKLFKHTDNGKHKSHQMQNACSIQTTKHKQFMLALKTTNDNLEKRNTLEKNNSK